MPSGCGDHAGSRGRLTEAGRPGSNIFAQIRANEEEYGPAHGIMATKVIRTITRPIRTSSRQGRLRPGLAKELYQRRICALAAALEIWMRASRSRKHGGRWYWTGPGAGIDRSRSADGNGGSCGTSISMVVRTIRSLRPVTGAGEGKQLPTDGNGVIDCRERSIFRTEQRKGVPKR